MSSNNLGTKFFKAFFLLIPWILIASGIAIVVAFATGSAGMESALGWGITLIILGGIGILAEFQGVFFKTFLPWETANMKPIYVSSQSSS